MNVPASIFFGCFKLFRVRRWLVRMVGLLLLLVALPAQARNDYIFPTNMPTGCSQVSTGNYECGELSFDYHDTVTIASPKPTISTIKVTGSLVTDSTSINPNGLASGLVFVVTETVTLGYGTTLAGSISASTGTVNLGQSVVVSGSIQNTTGRITIGYQGSVGGSLENTTGGVAVGERASVGGGVTTTTGPVSMGYQAQVGGSVSGTTGGITLDNEVKVGGSITSTTGYVIVRYLGQVCGGIDVSTGYVTLENEVKIGGSITGTTGPVTLNYKGRVVGSITTSTGGVSILNEAQVGANITTSTGAVNLGYMARVGGNVTTTGAKVYDPTSKVNDTSLVMSPVCATSPPAGSKAGLLECLETGSNTPWVSTARKPLVTRVVNTAFSFDVAVLKLGGSLETNFVATGGVAKSLTVELVNGSGTTACASRTAISPSIAQTLSFAAADKGRKVTANITVSKAYSDLRCRVTDASQSPSVVSCSSDNFSVRPGSVTFSTSPAMATPPSASSSSPIKAGASFTLRAATATAATDDYTGVLSLDSNKVTAQTTSQDTSVVSGGVVGTLRPSTLTANTSTSNNASYDEVGYAYLGAGAYRDSSFTAVDQGVTPGNDCIANSTSATPTGGLVGCLIGNEATVSLGRFYPDNFAISTPVVTAACGSTIPFSYFGQDGFKTAFSLTAYNAANGKTQNYEGVFAKLNPAVYSGYGFSAATLPAGTALTTSATAPSGVWVKGVAAVVAKHQVSRPAAPSAETLITVSAAPTDGEVAAGTAAAVGSSISLRYGRLKMQNAYGSELLPLPVPLEAQYWAGNFYVANTADSCTVINLSSVTMGNYLRQLNACETQISPVGNVVLVAGKLPTTGWVLSRPGVGNGGSVDLLMNLGATPAGTTCVGAAESAASAANMPWFGPNPSARAIFGIYKSPLIYRRENY